MDSGFGGEILQFGRSGDDAASLFEIFRGQLDGNAADGSFGEGVDFFHLGESSQSGHELAEVAQRNCVD